ncbi:ShlB/FhaC/HecB family hemolysin secretion/activation protein [Ancylobacter sp. SL191]|uniref:ShlB/FhaC/HecB family hemolysin secretion/activation protein n=1 Tax=Ancylobacter sp. SL191 TaxID=2995166 RepID=UPI00226EBCB5|nr:ShlB/FhaC/HecB family hemolysin secretion/activation protein [Ancylobacter sp. SL191]WAC27520.1 ShlB/FhaC/HecB family hemolysin secretion/activation protein [Ancylobacter sp. SL191]
MAASSRDMTLARVGALALGVSIFGAVPAFAQVIAPVERNLPPVISGQGRLVIGPQDLAGSLDETPLGVVVSGISLIGPKENVAKRPERGVRIGAVGDIDRAALRAALAPFLDQPLSRKRISDIQAAIAKVYRTAGYPFVSVTLPPQEVTGGVLTLQVVEFRTGAVKVSGAVPGTETDLAGRVRTAPGQRIAAEPLEEDLAWLNRFPYHSVNGVFAPGDDLGLSTLTLEVTPQKPWQVFAGYSNTGTHTTGFDRYFAGFGAAILGLPQSFVSYQITGSPNFWSDPSTVGTGSEQPNYYSQAGRLVIATGARQSLEIVPNYVSTRQNAVGTTFAFDNTTLEIPVYYRTAVSNLVPGLYGGDLILGATGKTVSRTTYFTGADIGGASAGLFELIAGWSVSRSDPYGTTSLDLKLIGNPGGVIGGNDAARWSTYSGGRVTDVIYAYGTGELNRVTRLPSGFSWVSDLSGTAAGQPLPDTEQLSLGGLYATRGYTLDDATVDTGLVWRNELRTPTFALLSALGVPGISDQASPYAFLDLSRGRSYGFQGVLGAVPRNDYELAGIGLGVDYTLNRNLTATLVGGFALTDATYTQAGDFNLQARVYVSY